MSFIERLMDVLLTTAGFIGMAVVAAVFVITLVVALRD
jgi:F0F1-type ATP synthase membrane subunit c/vacuolar-type H+-ATPase subunit K